MLSEDLNIRLTLILAARAISKAEADPELAAG
jgi:hypothetical protein